MNISPLKLGGDDIKLLPSWKYLGCTVVSGTSLSFTTSNELGAFYASSNSILRSIERPKTIWIYAICYHQGFVLSQSYLLAFHFVHLFPHSLLPSLIIRLNAYTCICTPDIISCLACDSAKRRFDATHKLHKLHRLSSFPLFRISGVILFLFHKLWTFDLCATKG